MRNLPDRAWLFVTALAAFTVALALDALTPLDTADWLLLLAAPAPLTFVARYARVRWRSTVSGRAIMLKSLGTSLFLLLACTTVVAGDAFAGRDVARVVVYGFLFTSQWYLTRLLFRLQREHQPRSRTDALTTEE